MRHTNLRPWLMLLVLMTAASGVTAAASPDTLMRVPEAIVSSEPDLLAAAAGVAPVMLDGRYRQFDLVIARVATWQGERDLGLRLWLPAEQDGLLPVVAYIHGGGFIGGDHQLNLLAARSGFAAALRGLLDAGFAVASLDYRLAREAGWPAPLQDTLCGLRFLALHGQRWGVDGQRIGVCGHSAGARIAALLGVVRQDAFHIGGLPWQEATPVVGAAWLWAGSALEVPQVSYWAEFGKPEQYSVARLLFGDHPAADQGTRHRLRLRHTLPHLSMAMPPVCLLRGANDYGGDHQDAEEAVRVWKALGAHAELRIVPGGHSATGPPGPFVEFFQTHLDRKPADARARQPLVAAARLLEIGQPAAALEVLGMAARESAAHPPAGAWVFLHDGQYLWSPAHAGWAGAMRQTAADAKQMLAQRELAEAHRQWDSGDVYRATIAARAVAALVEAPEVMELLARIESTAEAEAQLLKALAAANQALHDGDRDGAIRALQGEDPRLHEARQRMGDQALQPHPAWAVAGGVDVYGRWADLRLSQEQLLRLRWVAPGEWDLPEPLRYRNHRNDPWIERVAVEHGFWLGETEVTVAQWRALPATGDRVVDEVQADTGSHPVSQVSYMQIVAWLGQLSERHPDFVFRLPSEQQWVHAATAGGRYVGRVASDGHAVSALSGEGSPGLRPVQSVLPDIGGFRGMVGGVEEWTSTPGRHTARFQDDGGRFRVWGYPVARGGGWSSMPQELGPELRRFHRHTNRQPDLGFRLLISAHDGADRNWLDELNVE